MDIHLSFLQNILVFLFSGVCIWYFCNKLSNIVDFIDNSFGLGSAFGGTIILSIVTNLPEIAITLNGAIKGNVDLAVGNILGGITMQTVLLVLFDFASRKEAKPLSTLTNSKTSMLQGLFLIGTLSFVIIGKQFSNTFIFGGVTPPEIFIGLAWIGSILAMKRFQKSSKIQAKEKISNPQNFTKKTALISLVVVSIVVLVFGVLLENTSDAIATKLNINGVIFGATILAFVTSLPEISGGLAFVKNKSYNPIISDIFGGNAFLPVLFIPASIITGKAILPMADNIDIYLTTISIVFTSLFVMGMVISAPKRKFYMGVDSWMVLAIYICAMIGLAFL